MEISFMNFRKAMKNTWATSASVQVKANFIWDGAYGVQFSEDPAYLIFKTKRDFLERLGDAFKILNIRNHIDHTTQISISIQNMNAITLIRACQNDRFV